MSAHLIIPLSTFFISIGISQSVVAQSAAAEHLFWFDQQTGIENTGLINGREYQVELVGSKTHPFLQREPSNGQINFEGRWYSVPMLYDLYTDKIAIRYISIEGNAWFIEMDPPRVSEFHLLGRRFKNFGEHGFNEIYFESAEFALVVKRTKVTRVKNRQLDFHIYDRLFMFVDGGMKPVRAMSSFKSLFSSSEDFKKLKRFIRQNNLRVRTDRKNDLLRIATFSESLRNNRHQ